MPPVRSNGASRSAPGAELPRGQRGDPDRLALALQDTQQALAQVPQIAIEEIRDGLEAGDHVQAAERDMRSALRQLVLAEREPRRQTLPRVNLSARPIVTADDDSRHEARDDDELDLPRGALRELSPPAEPEADERPGAQP
jgi:hypothetical protein